MLDLGDPTAGSRHPPLPRLRSASARACVVWSGGELGLEVRMGSARVGHGQAASYWAWGEMGSCSRLEACPRRALDLRAPSPITPFPGRERPPVPYPYPIAGPRAAMLAPNHYLSTVTSWLSSPPPARQAADSQSVAPELASPVMPFRGLAGLPATAADGWPDPDKGAHKIYEIYLTWQ